MTKIKRRLTHSEEFEIMKLVLDKFLWLGVAFVGWGLYRSIAATFNEGIWYIGAGAVIMLIFAWIILSEFERLR
jgi:hypothetical protein